MAGKIRTVDIAKGHSAFCYAQFIESEQQRIFADMKTILNALHPFREGNGRAIRVFLSILAMRHGYHLDFHLADANNLMAADIAAFRGAMEPLFALYDEILKME